MSVYLPCPCLNVTVHLMKKPTQVPVTLSPSSSSSSTASLRPDNLFTPLMAETGWTTVIKGTLSLGGISIQHKELVFTREVKDWQISTCVNCKCDVYAVSTANDSSVYINPMLLTTPGPCPNCFLPSSRSPSPISNGSSSNGNEKKFSPAFHVMVDVKAPSITEGGKAPTYGNEEEMTLFDMLQTSFNKFVDDEQHQMAQRIAAYTEQESKELERVRTRALRDRDALWSKIKSYLNERNKKLARPTPTHPQSANMITTSSVSMQGTRNTRSKKGKKGQSDAHSKKTSSIAQSNTLSAQAQTLQTQMIVVNSPPQNQQQQQQHLHIMQDTIRVDPSPSPPSSQKSSPLVLAHKVAPLRPQPLQQQQTQPQQQQQQGTWSRSSKPSQLIQQQQQQQQKQQDTLGVSDNYGSGSDVFKLEEEYDEDIGQGTTNDGDSIEEEGNETSGSFSDNSSSNQEGDIDIDEEKAGMCSGAAPAMVSDMAVDNDNTYTATTGAAAAATGLVQGNNFEIQFRRDRAYNPSNTAYQFTLSTSLPIPITGNGRAGNGNGSGSGSGNNNNNNNNNNNSNSNSVRYKRQLQSQQQHQQQQYPYPQHGSASITTNSSQQRGGRKNGGGGAGVVVGVGGGHGKCCSTSFSGDGLQILYDNSNRDDNDVSSSFKVPQSLNKNTRAFLYV